jgi:hypothetical protein
MVKIYFKWLYPQFFSLIDPQMEIHSWAHALDDGASWLKSLDMLHEGMLN